MQPQFRTADSKLYPLYRSIKEVLTSPTFMKSSGILGFHCAYRYPEHIEGTYFYQRYPRTLKGIDAALFTVCQALGLTVHIKPYDRRWIGVGSVDTTTRLRDFISNQEDTDGESDVKEVSVNRSLNLDDGSIAAHEQFSRFDCGFYIGDEIFANVKWLNESPVNDAGAGYHEVAGPVTTWIGNETEVDWEYSSFALLVVVPKFSKRGLEDKV
jgi:hypothetical protein